MKRVFITGASGFIGTNLVEYLLNLGFSIANYDINPPRNISQINSWINGDVLDLNFLAGQVKAFRPNYFIHLAARTDLDGADLTQYQTNTIGVLNAIKSLQECTDLRRVCFASSRLVCKIGYSPLGEGDYCPDTFYGESKMLGEKLVRENSKLIPAPWFIFRPTSIWGPWFDTPYKEFFLSIYNSHYVHPQGSKISKSFGYVGNVVYILDKLMHCDHSTVNGKTVYIADYPPMDLKDWASMIAVAANRPHPREVPVIILKVLALAGDLLKAMGYKKPPLTRFRLNNLLTNMVYDTSLTEQICGRLPYSLQDGVNETVAWLNTNA